MTQILYYNIFNLVKFTNDNIIFIFLLIFLKVFPLHTFWMHWSDLIWHFRNIPCGRIIIFGIVGNNTSSGLRDSRQYLAELGSIFAPYIMTDTNWVWIFIKCGHTILETTSFFIQPTLHSNFSLSINALNYSLFEEDEREILRRKICEENEVLDDLCDSNSPTIPNLMPTIFVRLKNLENVPIIVTAGSRLHYFYYSLKILLQTPGIELQNIRVVIGGKKQNFIDICKLFSIKFKILTMYGKNNAMLFQYYRKVYQYVNESFPSSPAAIFLDEDVKISPDFFYYMNQTIPFLEKDTTLYCVNSYSTARGNILLGDPSKVQRAISQVTWGYAITLQFIEEALSLWPTNLFISTLFDSWLMHEVANKRECIFPERTRSLHFGINGVNSDVSPEGEIFTLSLPIVQKYGIPLSNLDLITLSKWNEYLKQDITNSHIINANPCQRDFIPKDKNGTFSFYYYMTKFSTTSGLNFQMAGVCLGIWAYSAQGIHDGIVTIALAQNITIHLIAVPLSSLSYLKPADIPLWDFNSLSNDEKYKATRFKNRHYFAEGIIFSSQIDIKLKSLKEFLFKHY